MAMAAGALSLNSLVTFLNPREKKNYLFVTKSLESGTGLQRCGKSCRLRWINYGRESDDVVERPFPHIDHLQYLSCARAEQSRLLYDEQLSFSVVHSSLHVADSESPVVTELPPITAMASMAFTIASCFMASFWVLRPWSWSEMRSIRFRLALCGERTLCSKTATDPKRRKDETETTTSLFSCELQRRGTKKRALCSLN